ncbi:Calcium-binding and coiled-coil domain-containing protein 2 [Apodemus speciosus]|uniref:Calcium-binding and coiled-coil domain-containing protein 2 n=1 Tax=Apodemus speciosus TaxID=105296 RepID=A0ABQ0FBS1_APOSI
MEQCPEPNPLKKGNSSQVLFYNVEKFYVPGRDLRCCYFLTEKFIPGRRDWIGIFKVGWTSTQEFYTFMWAPLPEEESARRQEIEFKAYYLPKDKAHYQFCYVDKDGLVQGTSISFQFCPDPDEDIMVVMNKERIEELEQLREELYQENQELRDKYADLHERLQREQAVSLCSPGCPGTHSVDQAGLELRNPPASASRVLELKACATNARPVSRIKIWPGGGGTHLVALEATQRINKSLEQEMEEKATWEEEKGSWKSELLQLKEYNKKIISEKEDMEIRVEELQAQLATQKKEMKKLREKYHKKKRQLEELKKENQLALGLTEQNHWEMLEQFMEMLKKNKAAIKVMGMEIKRPLQEPKNKARTMEEELVREVDRLKAKKKGSIMTEQLKNLLIQYDRMKKENKSLKNQVSLLKDDNKALQSFSSDEGGAEPEVPSDQGDAEPEVPSPQIAVVPALPLSHGRASRICVLFANYKTSHPGSLDIPELQDTLGSLPNRGLTKMGAIRAQKVVLSILSEDLPSNKEMGVQ